MQTPQPDGARTPGGDWELRRDVRGGDDGPEAPLATSAVADRPVGSSALEATSCS
jgi:hypothetical protein